MLLELMKHFRLVIIVIDRNKNESVWKWNQLAVLLGLIKHQFLIGNNYNGQEQKQKPWTWNQLVMLFALMKHFQLVIIIMNRNNNRSVWKSDQLVILLEACSYLFSLHCLCWTQRSWKWCHFPLCRHYLIQDVFS